LLEHNSKDKDIKIIILFYQARHFQFRCSSDKGIVPTQLGSKPDPLLGLASIDQKKLFSPTLVAATGASLHPQVLQ
jgi:hypothetical protein